MRLLHLSFTILFLAAGARGADPTPINNKLLEMYRLYYLPFSLTFRQGLSSDDVLPFTEGAKEKSRIVEPEELRVLEQKYEETRNDWRKKSLLLSTPVSDEKEVRITNRLVSHSLSADKSVVERLNLQDRMDMNRTLQGTSGDEKAALLQRISIRKLMNDSDKEKFNFFLVGPNWCESSKEYRVLLETYFKDVDNTKLSLHSVVLQDPKQGIFDSQALKELFPNSKRHSHESVPRFLAAEFNNGKLVIWEEAEAIQELYERFLTTQRGYLDSIVPFLKSTKPLSAGLVSH